jgi:hypothetical protein
MAGQDGAPSGPQTKEEQYRRLSAQYAEIHGRLRAHTARMSALPTLRAAVPLIATPAPSATQTLKGFDAVGPVSATPKVSTASQEDYWAALRETSKLSTGKAHEVEDIRATLLKSPIGDQAETYHDLVAHIESELKPALEAIKARPAEVKAAIEARKGDPKAPLPPQIGLDVISSGGRAYGNEEEQVGITAGKIADVMIEKFGSNPEGRLLLCTFVDAILSSAPLTETEGKGETEIRNGFYRAVAWCICAQTNLPQLREYLARNHLALIDAVGIATGISGNERLSPDESVRLLYSLMSHKWTSTGFNHMQTILRKAGMNGEVDLKLVSHFITTLMGEAERYQRISQSSFVVSAAARNLFSKSRESVVFLTEMDFYSLLRSRGLLLEGQQQMVATLHMKIAARFSNYAHSHGEEKSPYFVGFRPREIAHMFTTLIEGLGFIIDNPKIKDATLKLLDMVAASGNNPLFLVADGSRANYTDFKRILLLNLFTSQADMEKYSHLYSMLSGMHVTAEPNLADAHAGDIKRLEVLMARAASQPEDDTPL